MWLNDDKGIEDIPMGEAEDKFVRDLQEQIFEETKEAYGEAAFHRWLDPLYMGTIKEPHGYACLTGVCGDTMEIFLKFENDRVKEASFLADGCGSSIVCGSFAAEMSLGKNPDKLLEVTSEAILEKLEKLPKEDEHCASLAAETLQEALNDYMMKQTRGNS
jgi:nitrogen fixation NifU-like protein